MGEDPSKVYDSEITRKVGRKILEKVVEKHKTILEGEQLKKEKERWRPTLKRYGIPEDEIFGKK